MKEALRFGLDKASRGETEVHVWHLLHAGYFCLAFLFRLLDQESILSQVFGLLQLCVLLAYIGIQIGLVKHHLALPREQRDAVKAKLRVVFMHANSVVCAYLSMQIQDERLRMALLCTAQFFTITQCYLRASSFAQFFTCISFATGLGTGLWAWQDCWWAGMYFVLQLWGGFVGCVLWLLRYRPQVEEREVQTGVEAAEVAVQTEDEGASRRECRCAYRQLFLSARQPMLIVDLNIDAQKAEPHLLNPAARTIVDGFRGDLFESTRLEHADCALAELIQSMRRRFDDHALTRDKAKLLPHGAATPAHQARPIAVFDVTAASFNCDNDVRRLGIVMMEVPRTKHQEKHMVEHFKNSLICSLSHELCTPMNSLFPLLRLMPSCISEETKEDLKEMALSSAELLYSKIRDLFDYSNIELGKFKTEESDFFVEDLFQEIRQIFQFEIVHKDNVLKDIVHLISGRKLLILADRQRLKQVLIKLVANANKYTNKGVIRLEAAENQDNLDVEFTVKDSGVGIPADRRTLLFASLKQKAKYRQQHTTGCTELSGFGLTIAKSICENMGSQLSLKSEEHKGTSFTFTIPTSRLFGSLTPPERERIPDHSALPLRKLGCSFKEKKSSNKGVGIFRSPKDNLNNNKKQQSSFEASSNIRQDSSERLLNRGRPPNALPEVPLRPLRPLGPLPHVPPLGDSALKVGGDPLAEQRDAELASGPAQVSHSMDKMPREGTFSQSSAKSEAPSSVVLIVDDVYGNRFVLREMLQRLGANAMEVSDGSEAVELVRKALHQEVKLNIKIILMDLSMPIMDGIQATREIRALERELRLTTPIPIIAVTAHHDENDRESSMEAGMQGFVTKPVHVAMLKDLILKYVGPGKRITSPPS
jgi:signal transduction histidine kinase/CheY-like chemotaxis protein